MIDVDDRRRRLRWILIAAALAVVAVACFGAVLDRSHPSDASARAPVSSPQHTSGLETMTAAPIPTRSPAPSVPPTPTPRKVDPKGPPVSLSIPAIGVSRHLLRLGLNPDRTVEVPSSRDADFPGWYQLGPAPGQLGSAVILGHVDSVRGPAVFWELRSLVPGNHVDVRLRDGATAHFVVRSVATYPNDQFPARKVYASQGARALNLVTCGGLYDKAHGGYQSNVVAYTRLVDTTIPKAPASQS
jgi:hypothetical protein